LTDLKEVEIVLVGVDAFLQAHVQFLFVDHLEQDNSSELDAGHRHHNVAVLTSPQYSMMRSPFLMLSLANKPKPRLPVCGGAQ